MNDQSLLNASKMTKTEIKTLESVLRILKHNKVKEYKTSSMHIILDTVTYTDPNKLYESIMKQEKANNYGPTY